MKASQRSRTADLAAAGRASHTLYDSDPVFEDRFAIELTSPGFRRVVRNPVLHWFMFRLILGKMRPIVGETVGRHRYAEDRLASALKRSVRQYVILSAGLDSFALRRPDLATALSIFEVDLPVSQQAKRERFTELGIGPTNVTYLSVDFEKESLADALTDSAFSSESPAFFSWLGSIPYFTKEVIFGIFETVARSAAAGSEIVFDYLDPALFSPGPKSYVAKRLLRIAARRGEPMITGLGDEELRRELGKRGFEIVEILTPEDQRERYFSGRSDGLVPFEHGRFCSARVV